MIQESSEAVVMVIHGPNLNMLGKREPEIYGRETLEDIDRGLEDLGGRLGLDVKTYQTNHEGCMVEAIQATIGNHQGIIINPAAYTHTSVAVRDALLLVDFPVIEVHLSNIYRREPFRHKSMISDIVSGVISGFGAKGYRLALRALAELI